jgi:effector-binding domain-containing protein
VWNIEKKSFSSRRYAEFTYEGPFLTIKKTYKKLLY